MVPWLLRAQLGFTGEKSRVKAAVRGGEVAWTWVVATGMKRVDRFRT